MASSNQAPRGVEWPADWKAPCHLKEQCHRINWDYRLFARGGQPVAEKRISVWVREGPQGGQGADPLPVWQRIYSGRFPLVCRALGAVTVQDDAIVFAGGYLAIDDPGIYSIMKTHCLTLADTQTAQFEIQQSYCKEVKGHYEGKPAAIPQNFGRSIHLEMELAEAPDSHASRTPLQQPLFYFPQESYFPQDSAVFLGLRQTQDKPDTERSMLWTISNIPVRSAPFNLGQTDEPFTLTVSQDYDWVEPTKSPFFELMVDAIGVNSDFQEVLLAGRTGNNWGRRDQRKTSGRHDFGTHERTFYVGGVPATDDTGLCEAGWDSAFHGRIYRVYFDPNTNCNAC